MNIVAGSHFCQLDSIIIHNGGNASAPVLTRICGQKPYLEVTSTGNELFVIFTSDPTREFSGFNATFQSGKSKLYAGLVGKKQA